MSQLRLRPWVILFRRRKLFLQPESRTCPCAHVQITLRFIYMRFIHANLWKFNNVKHKILYIGQGNPKHKYRLGGEWIVSSPEEKNWGWTRSSTWPSNVYSQPRETNTLWLQSKQHCQQGEAANSAPLLCSDEASPAVLHPALEHSMQKGNTPISTSPEEAMKMITGLEQSPMKGGWESGGCSAWRRVWIDLTVSSSIQRGPKGGRGTFDKGM